MTPKATDAYQEPATKDDQPDKSRREKRTELRRRLGAVKCLTFACKHPSSDHQPMANSARKWCWACNDKCGHES